MKRIGLITIGQSPRLDILSDIESVFDEDAELLQRGALDKLTQAELAALTPNEGETVLVSCLRDGTAVTMAEERVIGLLQTCIAELESEGVACILFLCTGDFKDRLTAKVPLIYPNRILTGLLPALCEAHKLIVMVPDQEQAADAVAQWESLGLETQVVPISPYEGSQEDFCTAAESIKESEGSYVLLDCMGYTSKMKHLVESISGKIVILPRTLSASIVQVLIS